VLLNQKLNPATLENDSDKQKLMVLLRTFFEVHKGWHIQYNIVSRETLLEAKKHPDQYRDLVVRVAVTRRSSPPCRRMRRTILSPVPSIRCKSPRWRCAYRATGSPPRPGKANAATRLSDFHSK
jgi:formate C-acetyltransferase